MRVLLDALGPPGQPRGVGRYISGLVQCLAARSELEIIVAIAPWQAATYEDLATAGARIVTVRPLSSGRMGRHLWHLMKLPRLADRLKVDLIHLPDTLPVRRAAVPIVATIHDLAEFDLPDAYGSVQGRYRRWMARQEVTVAQRIITVSEFSRSRIESVFPRARGSVDVIPNGPGLSPLTVEEPLEAAVLSPFALFVGGIQRNKNLGRLIAAFRDLHDDSLQLVIAGPPSNDVRRTERMLRGGDNIRWIGQPTDGQLAWLYRHAEMLVLPTLYEGFGLPFLEAMAAGTPVLGPSSGAAAEVIGGAGYLVDPLEVAAIRDGIRRLRQDPVLRLTLIEAGKVRAQGYSWERAAQATHDVYLDAIRGPMASHPEPRA